MACAPVSPIVMYCERNVQPAAARRPKGQTTWTSPGGRSEFFAKTMPLGPGAHKRVTHGWPGAPSSPGEPGSPSPSQPVHVAGAVELSLNAAPMRS